MSKHVRPVPVVISAVALAAIAAGCSSSASSGSSKPPSAAGSGSSAAVNTGTATVSGKSETVLVAKDGKTLYYFMPDNASGKPTCTGSCASLWPPLIGTPAAGSGVTGTLTAVMSANGDQVTYNGHPLYEYSIDTAPGQANGEGVMNKWHAATPALASTGTNPAPSTGGSSGGSSGGGSY